MYLHGVGHFHPPNVICNDFLRDLDIGADGDWTTQRVGIVERRTVLPLDYIVDTKNEDPRDALDAAEVSNATMGAGAADLAIRRSGLQRSDIGMLICGSSAPDTLAPAQACHVAETLGLEVPAFDINSACTSFHAALYTLSMMDPHKAPDYILLVVCEALTKTTDYRDRRSAVLWGDAGAAVVVSLRHASAVTLESPTLRTSATGAEKVVVPRRGHFRQDGAAVQKYATKETAQLLRQMRSQFACPGRSFHFIGHQANLRMLENVCRMVDVPPERHHHSVVRYGNTASAGSLSTLSLAWDRLRPDCDVAVVGVGSGLTSGAYMARFEHGFTGGATL